MFSNDVTLSYREFLLVFLLSLPLFKKSDRAVGILLGDSTRTQAMGLTHLNVKPNQL